MHVPSDPVKSVMFDEVTAVTVSRVQIPVVALAAFATGADVNGARVNWISVRTSIVTRLRAMRRRGSAMTIFAEAPFLVRRGF